MNHQINEITINYKPSSKASERVKVDNPTDVVEFLRTIWNDKLEYTESCYVLLLNTANHIMGYNMLSQGGTTGTVVDIKMILQLALKSNVHQIILAHNHPSQNKLPSKADDRLTERLKTACEAIDLKLTDHIVLTTDDFYSYTENSRLC